MIDHGAPTLVVGFDLDLTLVDSSAGIRASFDALMAETGVAINVDEVLSRIGPKLEHELAAWFPPEQVTEAAVIYRRHYAALGTTGLVALPGAGDAIDAVRELGGRVLVVTAKSTVMAEMCLAHVGLVADLVAGFLHGLEKGELLVAERAAHYVGDTVPDIAAALHAGATPVGVLTGTNSEDELRAAGAAVVLADLTEFRAWLLSSRPESAHRLRGSGI